MLRVLGETRSLPRHSSIGSISAKTTSFWHASTHHRVQQGRQCAGHLAKTRHGAYLEYTHNIMLQHQGEDPKGGGSILSPVYSEASSKGNTEVSPGHYSPPFGGSVGQRERKGIPRTPFFFLRDAAHGKHAGWETNGVRRKQIRQHNQNI
ncbi:hypothetical protein TNCV_3144611 [Trichonephila clavipes]|nr:hypothetical protein TNCV_3144611 [Trichonephila clavipes]